MARTARRIEAGLIYHVFNRGDTGVRLFRKESDYRAFEEVLAESLEHYAIDLLTYCLMPNHWHFVVRPKTDEALGRWLGWVGVTYAHRLRQSRRGGTSGQIRYRGRFKSFPVAKGDYFLALCRFVESNPRRAGLVKKAEQWQWSGLWQRKHGSDAIEFAAWPVERPRNWLTCVNRELSDAELEAIQTCVKRNRPFGPDAWVQRTAARMGHECTLRSPGRPRKTPEAS